MKLPWHKHHGLMLAAFAGSAFAAAWPAWGDIFQIARHDVRSGHVWLVPLVVGWTVWARRERLRTCCTSNRALGAAIASLGAAAYLVGHRQQWTSAWHGGAALLLIGAIVCGLGKDILFRLLPAFVALVFVMPTPAALWHATAAPLQEYAASAAGALVAMAGTVVDRHGDTLSVGSAHVTVAQACDGMRMFSTLVFATYAFAFITPLRGWVRVLLLIATPLIAIVANVVWLVPTLYLYGHDAKGTAAQFQDLSGWVMLFVALLLLQGIVSLMRWIPLPVTPFRLAQA